MLYFAMYGQLIVFWNHVRKNSNFARLRTDAKLFEMPFANMFAKENFIRKLNC